MHIPADAPLIPSIPFDPNAINWVEILGITGGIVALLMVGFVILRWLSFRHELAKQRLEMEVQQSRQQKLQPKEEPETVRRLQERLENLEALICRLDAEMTQQWERSMTKGLTFSDEPGAVSQMPTALMNLISALEARYQVLKEIGRGGMGIVFQAHDKKLNEQVALKIISPLLSSDPEALERLKREVSSARRIAHPNIIRIFDIAESGGLHFVSMEFFPGQNLKEYIRSNGALSLLQGSHIVLQICQGLEAAHSQRIIHRDLKSQNVLIGPTGDVKIIDFGLARSIYMEGMTATGLIMGTPEYMSPEQVSGKKADERADIYSLGIILYEIFTGRLPFRGESAISVGFQQLKDNPPAPSSVNPQIPEELEAIILKALQKDPYNRYSNVRELRQDFEKILQSHSVEALPEQATKQKILSAQKQ